MKCVIDPVQNVQIVQSDMNNQEYALKIRLLKRENQLNRKRKIDVSQSEDSFSSSPSKLKSESSS